jgi:hypothetical protein
MKTVLVALVAALVVAAQVVSATRLRLLHTVEHDLLTSAIHMHDFVAVGPVGEAMAHYLVNSTTAHMQPLRGETDRDFVLLMGDVSVASYDQNHGKEIPPNTKDDGRRVDPVTKYYSYVFEDTRDANVLYVGFPGTSDLTHLWYDIKTWLGEFIHSMKEVCPSVREFPSEDIWQLVEDEEHKDPFNFYGGCVKMVQEIMAQYPGKKITFTGHSLGGAMAAAMSARFESPAVTFNSPGTFTLQQKKGLPTKFNSLLKTFSDARDLVSLFGLHAGFWCGYDIERQCEWYDLACYLSTPLDRHVLQNLLAQMERQPTLASCECAPTTTDAFEKLYGYRNEA